MSAHTGAHRNVFPLLRTSTSTQTQYVLLEGELAVTCAPCEESFSHSTAKINRHATKNLYTYHIICLKFYAT
jgi:hypothetical protein